MDFDPNVDYAKLMKDAITGGSYDPNQINQWAAARDAKIASDTAKYGDVVSSADYLKSLNYPGYVSPYAGQLNDLTNQIQNAQPYQSPYQGYIQSNVAQLMTRQFNYNPATDQGFQQASKELGRNTMEQMNERGILNSTVTENQVQQGVQQLLPQYEQVARNNFNEETNRLLNIGNFLQTLDSAEYGKFKDSNQRLFDVANYINGLDEKSYQMYKDYRDEAYRNKVYEADQKQREIDNQYKKIDYAYKKLQERGYVDNETSIILKLPIGMKSADALKTAGERKFELQKMAAELKAYKEKADYDYQIDKKLTDYKDSKNNPESSTNYNQFLSQYSNEDGEDLYWALSDGKLGIKPGTSDYNKAVKYAQDKYYQTVVDRWRGKEKELKSELLDGAYNDKGYYKKVLGINNYNRLMNMLKNY